MKIHSIKIESPYFRAVLNKYKTFEIRKNDRNYQVEDVLYMYESYEGTVINTTPIKRKIVYITDFPKGLKKGYVVLGIVPLKSR